MADYYTQATVTPYLPKNKITGQEMNKLEEYGFTIYKNLGKADEGSIYLYTDEFMDEAAAEVLAGILKRLPEKEYPYIYIEAAITCTKPRSDGFGGFACFITRDKIDWVGTGSWIGKQIAKYERRIRMKVRRKEDETSRD